MPVRSASAGGVPQHPRVCICILNWNGWVDTLECLESVLRSEYPSFQVVVVDNASADGSPARIMAWAAGELTEPARPPGPLDDLTSPPLPKPIRLAQLSRHSIDAGEDVANRGAPLVLVRNDTNAGYAAGMNLGLRYALREGGFEFVWLLNNDTVVRPDALAHLVTRASRDPDPGPCGSTLLYYDAPERVQALGGFVHNVWLGTSSHIGAGTRFAPERIDAGRIERGMFGVQGASVLVSRRFVEEVGPMTEDFFLYYEEHDWARRARRAGYGLGYAKASVVYHKEGRSTGATGASRHDRSWAADFHQLQSRLLFTRRHYGYALPTVYAGLLAAAANRLRRRQPERVRMIASLAAHCLLSPHARRAPLAPPTSDGSTAAPAR